MNNPHSFALTGQAPKPTPLLTVAEVARLLNVAPKTVRRRVRAGELEAYRVGSGKCAPIRIAAESVATFLETSRS